MGQVYVGGSARPAVRIELNPAVLANYGIGLEDVRTALGQVNSNEPKGGVANGFVRWTLTDNDQLFDANHYRPLIVAYHNGAPVRLGDIATVEDSVENLYAAGVVNGKQCIVLHHIRQPGANIVGTGGSHSRACFRCCKLPFRLPIDLMVAIDRTMTIRASVADIQITLLITVVLVILVIFVFLRNALGHLHSGHGRAGVAGRDIRRDVSARLFDRQPFTDGADDFHRLCRG